jgi:hypothetical protein
MSLETISLDRLEIASPCSASWADMSGDDKVRFCQHCQRHVYNLSSMSRDAAQALVQQTEGKPCVRFFRRFDGTLLTEDCPAGLRTVRRAARRGLTLLAAGLAAGFAFLVGVSDNSTGRRCGNSGQSSLRDIEPFKTFFEWVDPHPLMGKTVPPGGIPSGGPGSIQGNSVDSAAKNPTPGSP